MKQLRDKKAYITKQKKWGRKMKNECGKIIFRYSEKRRKNDMDPLMDGALQKIRVALFCMTQKHSLIEALN